MVTSEPASRGARRLLTSAARSLRTADPVDVLGNYLDESLSLPRGAAAYRRPHVFETRFAERSPRSLSLDLSPSDPYADQAARVSGTTQAMRQVVGGSFGSQALSWLDGRSEPLRYGSDDAWFTSSFDESGVRESQVTYAWGPQTTDSLAGPIHETVSAALDAMPALRPAFTTVRCGRSYGSQELVFAVDGALRLADLRPLMDRFGLGKQHARLVNALAFVLGARFVLPPSTTLLCLRPAPAGMELRLDVDLEAIPDIPPNVASLLQLQLVERPQGLAALENWVTAMTPSGCVSPGELSVLSVVVRPDLGPRLAIQMRPSVLVEAEPIDVVPVEAVPVAAGVRRTSSPWDPRP
ncbi:hypothetical protein [Kribbella endophytica]